MRNPLALVAGAAECLPEARALADELKIPCLDCVDPVDIAEPAYVLQLGAQLQLCATGRKAPGPVLVDFVGGTLAHRRKYGGGKGQQIAKAVGIRGGFGPRVVDATAGLGRDAFVLASLGCAVHMLERNTVVRALLRDGLERLRRAASEDPTLAEIAARMTLEERPISALDWLAQQPANSIPVVYLDPMFPARDKSAKVKKEMAAFHQLVGSDEDADALLAPAYAACYYRVVVKRPRVAPFLAGKKPALSLQGKSGRFDIYTKHGIPT
ncbi:class I SAM-dependent methyltransferase [Microbulbifer thermotolerans]|uniref:Ribosomal RNA small subunit methyltransferase J n=1 Tax=Microbulbifer thermotolerans TaxID=252514 RepID=A0A143HL58_MICTH|nr:class I SAM-dependent methyltransferase [Microbulbifer thermotolerans]AMX02423.1 SAM-dependent methyltransferase [Microbulbifer thermotolerans]MCX2780986.1 class I SAM-dependent methyltransferase [Microbulbifer thermotolerans]MCX2784568.1 class I SAM-dependent methyltransferase [Microbulbifer thermotolerans]MCX2806525.1 class I SAM-dependent methyltransferase [Microbulbifer thermotolerans]MCX2832701.1 class I SAM-dependent methyltransferase [Microbulbifer thermotolerans]